MWLCCPSCRTKCTKYCILIGKRREFLCDEKDFPFSKVHKNFWRLWTEVLWPKCICFPPSCLRQVGSCAISNGYKAAHVTHPGWVTPQISGKSRKISGSLDGIVTGLMVIFFSDCPNMPFSSGSNHSQAQNSSDFLAKRVTFVPLFLLAMRVSLFLHHRNKWRSPLSSCLSMEWGNR